MTDEELDLIEARECAAQMTQEEGYPEEAEEYRNGGHDQYWAVRFALLVIRRAKERNNNT